MRDAADLDARAVGAQAVLQLALDRAVVALLLHVDEVDDDEAGEVAQPKLARNLLRRFEVGLERRVLDRVLARGAPGVDVDRDQRLGLVDDDVAAGLQRHLRGEHRVELRLDAGAREDRDALLVELDVARMARHEHAHEVLGLAVGVVAGDDHLVDLARIEVADRALDEVAFLVDELRRGGAKRQLAHVLPKPEQIFEVALDLALGAVGAGGPQDHAHALRHFEVGGDRLHALAVGRRGDLAGDAAAARRVRHEHRVAAGER